MNQTKRPKFIAREIREILAENVRRKLDEQYPNALNKPYMLSKRIGTSKSTVQRAMSPDSPTGISVDILALLAMGLRCDPADLLRRPPEWDEDKRPEAPPDP